MTDKERVDKVSWFEAINTDEPVQRMDSADAVKLLKAEQRSIARMVKNERDELNPTLDRHDWGKGFTMACNNILKSLAERGKR